MVRNKFGNTAARALRAAFLFSGAITLTCFAHASGVPTPTSNNQASSPAAKVKPRPQAAKPYKLATKPITQPLWRNLTSAQQKALQPLALEWDKLDIIQKKKWLIFAKKFPLMTANNQQRVHERMRDWAKLTIEQRRTARESYARTKKLNPDQKSAEWKQYQQLPEAQKQKLAAEAAKKKRVANLPRTVTSKSKLPPTAPVAPALAPSPLPQSSAPPAATPEPLQTSTPPDTK